MSISDEALWSTSLTHSGKLYSCNLCERSFDKISNMKQHVLLHTGEKPFSCEQCGKEFRRKYHLNKHKLLHTGEKPHRCELCGAAFRRVHHLSQHVLSHVKKFNFDLSYPVDESKKD